MEDHEVTLWEDLQDPESIPPGGNHVMGVGLAADKIREQQKELLCRFSQAPATIVSDNPGF
jgi:hypothetical protein